VIVTVAGLLEEHEDLLSDYRLRQDRRAHAGRARRVTVLPRTTADRGVRC
jgi:hypothetical protein